MKRPDHVTVPPSDHGRVNASSPSRGYGQGTDEGPAGPVRLPKPAVPTPLSLRQRLAAFVYRIFRGACLVLGALATLTFVSFVAVYIWALLVF